MPHRRRGSSPPHNTLLLEASKQENKKIATGPHQDVRRGLPAKAQLAARLYNMSPPFTSPQGNAVQTLAALWSLTAVSLAFVILRLYTRYKVVDAIGIDDHLFNIAFVSAHSE